MADYRNSIKKVRVTEVLLKELDARRIYLRPRFTQGDALGRIVSVSNAVSVEPYARIDETSLSWEGGVEVGAFSYVTPRAQLPYTTVGRYCSVATGVSIMPLNHPLDRVTTSTWTYGQPLRDVIRQDFGVSVMQNQTVPTRTRTTLGHDVWLGQGCLIKPGITLHTGCVVGAHAVVTKDVPPYTIVAGNPARPVRARFSPEVVQALLASAWWDLHPTVLAPLNMQNPEIFLQQLADLPADAQKVDWQPFSLTDQFLTYGKAV